MIVHSPSSSQHSGRSRTPVRVGFPASRALALLAALGLWGAACGGEAPPARPAAPIRPAPAPEPAPVSPRRLAVPGPASAGAQELGADEAPGLGEPAERVDASAGFARGKLLGRIYVEASTERPGPLVLDDLQVRHCNEFGGVPDLAQRALVTDAAGGLAEVVIWVDVPKDPPKPDGEPAIVKRGNRFEPHLLVVRPGVQVLFENADPCTSTLTLGGGLNLARPLAAGGKHWQAFTEPGEFAVGDAVHPWTQAWVAVRPGAHSTVTGRDGSYELPGLPPGEHVLRVWHPTLGRAEAPFVLEPGAVLRLELGLPAQ